ncbi:hypothetical protein DL89DRAFT_84682 [Linderina pennispora]|uniref:Uncharacterized protein n=1 Tax=Linderina pennispora TaxID=61395 RepID=A0A1Y1WHH1_9FUNG|nr:uncharacterized protein DL89DRAFT_84682 [Linderina pennispora]ORX72912.1 hypothetical protein DL89DRAFT_84682 [Linderina pennispora]
MCKVFNWTVDIVNSYLEILNSRLLEKWAKLPKLSTYAHVDESQGELRVEYFFHSMPALGAVAGAALDDIFQACALGQISPLVAHLRALEFTTRHQLDLLQQRMPSDLYLERTLVDSEIADAKLTAQQSADQAADLCRQGAMVVESPPASVISMQSVPSLKRTQCCSEFAEPPLSIIAEDINRSTLSVKRTRLAASARLSKLQEALARAHQQLQ